MKIWFIGQLGIPEYGLQNTVSGSRIEALSVRLAEQGHEVFVACVKGLIPGFLSQFKGINLVHISCLNPLKPGGWLYTILSILKASKSQPDIVHVHGWKAGSLIRLAALLSPETTYIWTIEGIPSSRLARFVAWQAKGVFDAVTAPSRQMQYLLLHLYNLRTVYVPDGYSELELEDIPVKTWGLRRGQYTILFAEHSQDVEWIGSIYEKVITRKKLIVICPKSLNTKALTKKYPFLLFLDDLGERSIYSLVSQSAALIVSDPYMSSNYLLHGMDAMTPILSISHPHFEEILGTTATIVKRGNLDIDNELTSVVKFASNVNLQTRKASSRARSHFSWSRVLAEYLSLYRLPYSKSVPMDSAQPVVFTRVA